MRARLAGLERRANHPLADKTRLAPDCLKELESAVGQLELAREQLHDREEELRELRGRIGDWQQRLLALVDTLDEAYLLTELDGVILESNQAAARLLNISTRFLAGRPLHLFLAAERVEFLRFLQNLPGCADPETLAVRIRPRERHCLLVTLRARVVPGAGGGPKNVQWLIARSPASSLALPAAVDAAS
jgi:PAS domain-containing protein